MEINTAEKWALLCAKAGQLDAYLKTQQPSAQAVAEADKHMDRMKEICDSLLADAASQAEDDKAAA